MTDSTQQAGRRKRKAMQNSKDGHDLPEAPARKGRGPAGKIYVRERPERKTNRFEARADVGGDDGKRQQRSFYGSTAKEARQKAQAALKAREDGLPVHGERLTVAKWLTDWLETYVKPNSAPLTYVAYRKRSQYVISALGRKPLKDLTPQHVQELLNAKSAPRDVGGRMVPGLSPRTVGEIRATLGTALNEAMRQSLVNRNVAALARPPRRHRNEVKPLDPEGARRFLECARESRLFALYAVALSMGLRRGEALGLTWQCIDLEARSLRVSKQLVREEGHLHLKDVLKTKTAHRAIALPAFAVNALREHRSRQLEERLKAGAAWQEHDLVFVAKKGVPLDPDNMKRDFYKLRIAAGVPEFRFHDLRHTCASLLLVQGVAPRVVMDILGHSQMELTMSTYSHVLPVLQRDAADQMDALLTTAQRAI